MTSGIVLATTAALLGGLVTAVPAAADEPGDNPADPYQRTLRISLGAQARKDRCQVSRAVHYGGPEAKTLANSNLSGPPEVLRQAAMYWNYEPSILANQKDVDAGGAYADAYQARQIKLNETNKPYASTNSLNGRSYHAPEFGADILSFTLKAQREFYNKTAENPTPRPGKPALDKAKQVFDALSTPGDSWATAYKPVAGNELFGFGGSETGSANDVATFLRFGGFPTKAPEADSAEFRSEVETLKLAWAGCDSDNPIDHYRVLSGTVLQAYTEWEAEYASQAAQRKEIVTAEAAAAKELRIAADAMIEAIRQAWQADQILFWQKHWAANKDSLGYPKPAAFAKATADLSAARTAAAAQVPIANNAVTKAKAAADKAAAQQTAAWAIADQAKLPRGRGLMYAQQSVQVAKASYAATQAAAKTALTASNAAKATVADSSALYALSKTQAHALNTEFRKAAALEAATQAKAAATAADAQAKEAAANATKAKNAQATAEKAEQTAKAGAAEAKRQRAIAEAEKVNAERERDLAAAERAKAAAAEQRARTERDAAGRARTAAEAAGVTAATQRQAAQQAEIEAYKARDRAVAGERARDATASRAAALEAAAAAAVGTAAAAETRQAATEARSAANEASGAATRARTAANEATTAAVNARAAATRAEGAAARSRAASDAAWSAYEKTRAAAATAHAAAAEAIDAAAAAKTNADNAEAEAKKAQAAAVKARQEATAAKAEAEKTAAWAAKTAGFAYAAGQAAQGARDAANAVVKAANEAIAVGSPYRETDTSAAFAVLVGQTSKTLAEQQAAAAQAKANEASKAAAEAKALADKAAGDAKIAAQAAAAAAADAVKALQSVAAARASAAEAAKAAAAAEAADARAQQYDAQAGTDAFYASSAAGDAETAAAQADRDATEAERDAAGARSAASAAESDASAARSAATTAERDATKAETAAANAQGAAKDADAAATRAEEAERQRLAELRKQRADAGSPDVGPALSQDDEAILLRLCGQECVDQFRAARALAGQDLLDWLKANGGQILLDYIGWPDLKNCLTKGDIESCLWTLVNVVGMAIPVAKIPAIGKAILKISTGIVGFFEKSAKAKHILDNLKKLIDKAKKEPDAPGCKPKSAVPAVHRSASVAAFSAASASSASSNDPSLCDYDPDEELPFELLEDIDKRYGTDVADGIEYQWRRMMSSSSDAADHHIPGIGRDLEAMAKYFEKWRGKATHLDTDTNNKVAYDPDKGFVIVIKQNYIHGHKKSESDWLHSGRYKELPK
ncbi:hypothetical protein [Streptomyces sp. CB03238]|uniref:hypothetical protein n=1 Tax=Streptomyces sp. CB03238 TaxID=1907777 RepID=UPI000A1188A9|nr:hypothetical protein [Streptomyces sp. CB03238]ORT55468.1 hypothetical protein BKD26_31970 [Streptomyces sp. CB03238]